MAVIEVAEVSVKLVAATVANLTEVAADRFVPVMVTEVPPATRPVVGLSPVTVGAAT